MYSPWQASTAAVSWPAVSPPAVMEMEAVVPRNLMGSFDAVHAGSGEPCGLALQLMLWPGDSHLHMLWNSCCYIELAAKGDDDVPCPTEADMLEFERAFPDHCVSWLVYAKAYC